MRIVATAGTAALAHDNLAGMLATVQEEVTQSNALAWYACLMDLADSLAKGQVLYVTIGLNQKKTSLLVTVNPPTGEKTYVAATTADDLAYQWAMSLGDSACVDLLPTQET